MQIDTYGWAPIVKAEKQEDGTLLVTGRVSDDGLDRDAQRCDAAWLDRAVPQWFAEGGNVREMHGHIAAGVALNHWKADDAGHMVTARVVDSGSVAKVEAGVLKGFSIGIKNGRITKSVDAPNGRIVDGSIIEVSLVDRPANPSCLLTIAKADESTGEAVVVEQELVEVKADEGEPVEEAPADLTAHTEVVAAASDTVRERAQSILDTLSGMDLPPWVKDDEASNITDAQDAISIIARLIQAEAASLAAGQMDERYDIDLLLSAVAALTYFISSEASEAADEDLGLSDEPEVTKTEGDEDPAEPVLITKADLDTLRESMVAQFDGLVAEALTKADEVHKAEVETLRDELAKVKALPSAGGPVRVRVPADRVKADEHDRRALVDKANDYLVKAENATDPSVADGYRDLAREAHEKATR